MTRSVPRRVKTASWTASSSSVPWCRRPPISEYSPSLFSRTITMSTSAGVTSRSGEGMPGHSRTGRRFTYWRKARRIGISRPHSETWSGTSGPADRAEEDRVAVAQGVERVGRHHAAGLDEVVAAPRVLGQPQLEPVRATDRLEHLERGGRDLAADAVARDHGDRVGSDGGHGRSCLRGQDQRGDLVRGLQVGQVRPAGQAAVGGVRQRVGQLGAAPQLDRDVELAAGDDRRDRDLVQAARGVESAGAVGARRRRRWRARCGSCRGPARAADRSTRPSGPAGPSSHSRTSSRLHSSTAPAVKAASMASASPSVAAL